MPPRFRGKSTVPPLAWFALVACSVGAQAQSQRPEGPGSGIYSCTDARGRTLTADRPIAECADREQRELGPSGTTRRRIDPVYTAREQAERDERAREEAVQAARQLDERRRDRAMLVRYPDIATHERGRADALVQIDAVIDGARKRIAELGEERRKIDLELEFYKSDVSKAPPALRRRVDDNTQAVSLQNRVIGDQQDERKRVNARFDDDRARLRQLWSPQNGGTPR